MKILSGRELREAKKAMALAVHAGLESTCRRSRCGSVIINGGVVLGEGFNSPPRNLESQRRCSRLKEDLHAKVTDRTCCVHAEQRAMMAALRDYGKDAGGAVIYFARLGDNGRIKKSGEPYCTICSKMALDIGIDRFVLWQERGVCSYSCEEYNQLSYEYKG